MSDFASEGKSGEFAFGADDLQLSEYERDLARKLFRPQTFLGIDDSFISYLAERLALAGLRIPISQIQGFSGFTTQSDEIGTSESTTSGTFTDLATVGPTLDGLSPGKYLILFGAAAENATASAGAYTSISVNGAAASLDDAANTFDDQSSSIMRAVTKTLSDASNTVTMQYMQSGGGTAQFLGRWLIALKYSNL